MLGQLDFPLNQGTSAVEAASPVNKKDVVETNVMNELVSCIRSLPSSDTLVVSQPGFRCEWNACGTTHETLQALVLHVHNHIHAISKEKESPFICQWTGCWNPQPFSYQQRLIEHMRAHTLEKPYMCPVKSCGQIFTVRSNCMAHGRAKHNRTYKPIFIDITTNETSTNYFQEEEPEDVYQDDAPDTKTRSVKRKAPSSSLDLVKRSKRPIQVSPKAQYESEVSILDEKKVELEKFKEWANISMIDLEDLKNRYKTLATDQYPKLYITFLEKTQKVQESIGMVQKIISELKTTYDGKVLNNLKSLYLNDIGKSL